MRKQLFFGVLVNCIIITLGQTVEKKDADYEAELALFNAEIEEVEAKELAEFLGMTTMR